MSATHDDTRAPVGADCVRTPVGASIVAPSVGAPSCRPPEQGSAAAPDFIDFIEAVAGDSHLRVEEELGSGFVRLRSAEAERRQAKHDIRCVEDIVIEMLRNARDADATTILVATTREGDERSLVFIDDGAGIPPELHELIFEPRVTSKLETMVMDEWGVHGRGMALYSVRSNALRAKVASSAVGLGSALEVLADAVQLGEKRDQSSAPIIELSDDNQPVIVRGPHNIARHAYEFTLANRKNINVYLGSVAEVVATLVKLGNKRLSREQLLFCDDLGRLPICERLAGCGSAGELVEQAAVLGLIISERSAFRILAGQIAPLHSLNDEIAAACSKRCGRSDVNISRDTRGLKLAQDDIESFSRNLETAFEPLAQRYYLQLNELPKITVKGDKITATFSIEKQ
jgi:hypothetical protein